MRAQLPDRLPQIHLTMLQLDAGSLLQRLGDVAAGHGAEQLPLLPHPHLDSDGAAFHLGEQVLAGLLVQADLAPGLLLRLGLSYADVVLRGRGGQPTGQQVVASEAAGDVLDLTDAGGAFHFLQEHDLHATLLTG